VFRLKIIQQQRKKKAFGIYIGLLVEAWTKANCDLDMSCRS
jgi:hypothetical protein